MCRNVVRRGSPTSPDDRGCDGGTPGPPFIMYHIMRMASGSIPRGCGVSYCAELRVFDCNRLLLDRVGITACNSRTCVMLIGDVVGGWSGVLCNAMKLATDWGNVFMVCTQPPSPRFVANISPNSCTRLYCCSGMSLFCDAMQMMATNDARVGSLGLIQPMLTRKVLIDAILSSNEIDASSNVVHNDCGK